MRPWLPMIIVLLAAACPATPGGRDQGTPALDSAADLAAGEAAPLPGAPVLLGEATAAQALEADTLSWDHTVPSSGEGARLLLVLSGVRNGAEILRVTYGAAELEVLRVDVTDVPDARSEIWYLLQPDVGTQPITVTFDRKQALSAGATSWTGIDPRLPFEGIGAGGTIGAPTSDPQIRLVVPCVPGGTVVDVITVQTPHANLTVGADQAELWQVENDHLETRASSRGSTAAVTTLTWAQTGTGVSGSYEPYAHSAVCLRRAPR